MDVENCPLTYNSLISPGTNVPIVPVVSQGCGTSRPLNGKIVKVNVPVLLKFAWSCAVIKYCVVVVASLAALEIEPVTELNFNPSGKFGLIDQVFVL